MAIDPAVVAVWEIVIGILIACVAFIIAYYMQLRLQRNHAYYRFGEAMSIGYAQMMTGKIYGGGVEPMPQSPKELSKFARELEEEKVAELAQKKRLLDAKAEELSQNPPTQP